MNTGLKSQLLLHDSTKAALQKYLNNPVQVLAIVGEEGAGKHHLALVAAAELLGTDVARLANETRLIRIEKDADKQEIAIDAVRQLIKALRVKQPGGRARLVLIKDAHFLSHEAQNALLKTLEQPNPDTYFILTVANPSKLLPTVLSRTQKLTIHPVADGQAKKHYGGRYPSQEIERAWTLSEGLTGTLNRLLSSDEHELKTSVEMAKNFLAMTKFQRLVEIEKVSKDKEKCYQLLAGLARTLKALHHSAIRKSSPNASRLLAARKLVQESQQYLDANGLPKLVLLRLVMRLRV